MVEPLELTACRFAVDHVAEFGNTGFQVIPVQDVSGVGQGRDLSLAQLSSSIGEDFHACLIGAEMIQHDANTLLEMYVDRLNKCQTALTIITLYRPTCDHFEGLFFIRVAVPQVSSVKANGGSMRLGWAFARRVTNQ